MDKIQELIIGDLKISKPIVQGGMGVAISLSSLAGNVAKEGGLGIISSAQIGYRKEGFANKPIETNIVAIGEELKKARMIAGVSEGAVGFNIMVATEGYADYVREAVRCSADIIICGAGLPVALPLLLKEGLELRETAADELSIELAKFAKTSVTKIAPIVSSAKSAFVILKMWDRKYKTTADMIVIEGPLAGGHLGFSKEELTAYGADTANVSKTYDRAAYEEEIKKIIEIVKEYADKYSKTIPVVVAGGIYDKADLLNVLSLGADGVQVGTRFVTTKECDAPENYKMAYINSKEEDIVIVKSPVGMPGRAIKNDFLNRIKTERPEIKRCFKCLAKCDICSIPYCITEALIAAADGDTSNSLLFCGSNAWRAKKIETVHEVMESFFN